MKNILLVDDKPDIRDSLADYLEGEGYKTETCDNGEQAIEKVKNAPYDLVITDLLMPKKDGFNFLNEFQNTETATDKTVPIIVITGGSRSLDFQKGLDSLHDNGCYILRKPFNMSQFSEALERALPQSA